MGKYAALVINYKTLPDGTNEYRRVLIRYGKFKDVCDIRTYYDTALIAKDSYFETPQSHTYVFDDNSYAMTKTYEDGVDVSLLNEPRRYHAYLNSETFKPIEFGAEDDDTAKMIYKMFSK